jgi:hypothetical protein
LSLTRRAGEKINVTGLDPKTLKKLKGDKFMLPSLSRVLAKQIGLGATAVNKALWKFAKGKSFGPIVFIVI